MNTARYALVALGLLASGCAAKQAGPPGDPLRPKAKELPAVVTREDQVPVSKPLGQAPEDCDPVAPNEGPPPKPYRERRIDEAAAIAKVGLTTLIKSEDQTREPREIGQLIEEAVDKFFSALAADPYNPNATYNLAAAYARIGRNQCALNLLARMTAMRNFHSLKEAIGGKSDRLFGRGKKWKGKPDPDFDQLRKQAKFREITKDL